MKHTLLSSLFLALGPAVAQGNVSPVPASATKGQPTTAIVQQVRVAPGQLGGHVLDGTTRQPVANHVIQLLDSSGTKLNELTTTANGTYTTPALQKGNYTLLVREDLKLHLSVAEDAKITNLDIVVPQGPAKKLPQDPKNLPAAPGGAAPVLPPPAPIAAPGLGLGGWALAAGGAAAVAVPVVANNSGGGGESNVSASGLGVRR